MVSLENPLLDEKKDQETGQILNEQPAKRGSQKVIEPLHGSSKINDASSSVRGSLLVAETQNPRGSQKIIKESSLIRNRSRASI